MNILLRSHSFHFPSFWVHTGFKADSKGVFKFVRSANWIWF